MKNKKGFTLVELLVVVGIIGILASIGVASLNSARQKARDAKRIADVKQMSTILEAEEGSTPNQPVIDSANAALAAGAKTDTAQGPGAEIKNNFPNLKDPSSPTGDPCAKASAKTCEYSISSKDGASGATTASYSICFYLESGGAGLAAGANQITNGSILAGSCPR